MKNDVPDKYGMLEWEGKVEVYSIKFYVAQLQWENTVDTVIILFQIIEKRNDNYVVKNPYLLIYKTKKAIKCILFLTIIPIIIIYLY